MCHIRGLSLLYTGKCLSAVSSSQLFLISVVSWTVGNMELTQASASSHLIPTFLHCIQRRPAFSVKANRPQCNVNLKINSKLFRIRKHKAYEFKLCIFYLEHFTFFRLSNKAFATSYISCLPFACEDVYAHICTQISCFSKTKLYSFLESLGVVEECIMLLSQSSL